MNLLDLSLYANVRVISVRGNTQYDVYNAGGLPSLQGKFLVRVQRSTTFIRIYASRLDERKFFLLQQFPSSTQTRALVALLDSKAQTLDASRTASNINIATRIGRIVD